jgi:hypothetical protein
VSKDTSQVHMVISTRCFSRVESIDSGDTIVLHFRAAGGEPAAVMIPRKAAQAVHQALAAHLEGRKEQARNLN